MSMNKQRGYTFWSATFMVVLIVAASIVVIKIFPAYVEYFVIKRILVQMDKNYPLDDTTDADIRAYFDKSASVNEIRNVSGNDLNIVRHANGATEVLAEYAVKTPLVANVSLWMDFKAASNERAIRDDGGAAR